MTASSRGWTGAASCTAKKPRYILGITFNCGFF